MEIGCLRSLTGYIFLKNKFNPSILLTYLKKHALKSGLKSSKKMCVHPIYDCLHKSSS